MHCRQYMHLRASRISGACLARMAAKASEHCILPGRALPSSSAAVSTMVAVAASARAERFDLLRPGPHCPSSPSGDLFYPTQHTPL